MSKKKSDSVQPAEGLEGKDEFSTMDDQLSKEIDPQKVEKAEAELKVLKEFLKKQQSQKNITKQKERRQ
ncbi:hypothetical protein HQ531_14115 [bacterium]|nr:hypothetical protein [bacterium]